MRGKKTSKSKTSSIKKTLRCSSRWKKERRSMKKISYLSRLRLKEKDPESNKIFTKQIILMKNSFFLILASLSKKRMILGSKIRIQKLETRIRNLSPTSTHKILQDLKASMTATPQGAKTDFI